MDGSINVSKAYLENTTLHMYHVVNGKQQTYVAAILQWCQSSNRKHHSKVTKVNKWSFSVRKRYGKLEVTCTTEKYYTLVDCFVVNSKTQISEVLPAITLSDFSYKFEIPLTFIDCRQNVYTMKNNLFLMIRFMAGLYAPIKINTLYRKGSVYQSCANLSGSLERMFNPITYEEEAISSKLAFTLEQRYFTDFVIHAQTRKIHVHKSILASRSTYFRDYISRNCDCKENEIRMNARYNTVITVVRFLYTGRMEMSSQDNMSEVYSLVRKLNLTGFCHMYESHCMKAYYQRTGNIPQSGDNYAKSVGKHIQTELPNRTKDKIIKTSKLKKTLNQR